MIGLMLLAASAYWAGGGSRTPSAGGAQQNLHRRLAKYSLLEQSMALI